jgi:hypothetical protein
MMHEPNQKKNDQSPNKSQGKPDAAIGVLKLKKKTETEQKREYHIELPGNKKTDKTRHDFIAQKFDMEVLKFGWVRPGIILLNHVYHANAQEGKAPEHVYEFNSLRWGLIEFNHAC